VARKGKVNASDNELFVKTVRETGKKTLIMACVWTSVCVMFPALDAKAAGFKVYAVIDASGDPSEILSKQPKNARATAFSILYQPYSTYSSLWSAATCRRFHSHRLVDGHV